MAQVLVIRHAIAEDRHVFAQTGQPDDRRPLTERGKQRMIQAAKGLRRVAPDLTAIASSPYTRALQTARIVAKVYGDMAIEQIDSLTPSGRPEALAAWLAPYKDGAPVAIVGHEPHLSEWIGWAVTPGAESFLEFKKGGACLLAFSGPPAAGRGRLLWALAPRHLRMLGDGG